MFERYTEKARRVIFFARYEASQFGSPYIESEHLLLGLLREQEGLAARTLHDLGLDEARVRDDVVARDGRRDPLAAGRLPFAPLARDALVGAQTWADRWGHPTIGTEHVLVGVLDEPGSVAVRLLADSGHAPAAVAEELCAAIGFSDPADEAGRLAPPSPEPDERTS